MKIRSSVSKSFAFALLAAVAVPSAAVIALTPVPAYAYDRSERYYDRQDIEQLTAPIALYSDPLLAQILTAAAYPEEIVSAQRYARGRSDWNDIDRQDWDPSVRAIARYPEVLDFLARDLEWTQALGIANINQPEDVADAIQRWRLQAYDLGNLRSGSQQVVYVNDGYVRIVPADEGYFYVPRYQPDVIYVTRYVSTPFIFFGSRYSYGSWFDRDWDWRSRRVYYSDRSHWRNGRPVFYPQFDRVYVDRNRNWEPDRRRFNPPERPHVPARFTQTRIPSPPADVKPGVRRDNHPQNQPGVFRPGDKPDGDRDNRRDDNKRDQVKPGQPVTPNAKPDTDRTRQPTVRGNNERDDDGDRKRGDDRSDKPAIGKPQTNPPPQRTVEPPKRVETPRKVEQPAQQQKQPTQRVEQPRRVEQPVKAEPPKRVEQPRQVEQPKPQVQPQQPQKQEPPRKTEEEQQQQRGGLRR